MEKIKKMGDGECCPEGEICEEPTVEPTVELTPEERVARSKQYVNPYEIPYVQSDHVKELIARAEKKEQKLKIVQKRK
jgi:hypothetical protein